LWCSQADAYHHCSCSLLRLSALLTWGAARISKQWTWNAQAGPRFWRSPQTVNIRNNAGDWVRTCTILNGWTCCGYVWRVRCNPPARIHYVRSWCSCRKTAACTCNCHACRIKSTVLIITTYNLKTTTATNSRSRCKALYNGKCWTQYIRTIKLVLTYRLSTGPMLVSAHVAQTTIQHNNTNESISKQVAKGWQFGSKFRAELAWLMGLMAKQTDVSRKQSFSQHSHACSDTFASIANTRQCDNGYQNWYIRCTTLSRTNFSGYVGHVTI